MKNYKLDLSEYKVTIRQHVRNEETSKLEMKELEEAYPLQTNLCNWLRLPGVWKNGVEICDACDLAKQIKACTEDELTLNDDEMKLLRQAMNRLIEQKEDPAKGIMPLGGEIHEEAIRRVFRCSEA